HSPYRSSRIGEGVSLLADSAGARPDHPISRHRGGTEAFPRWTAPKDLVRDRWPRRKATSARLRVRDRPTAPRPMRHAAVTVALSAERGQHSRRAPPADLAAAPRFRLPFGPCAAM